MNAWIDSATRIGFQVRLQCWQRELQVILQDRVNPFACGVDLRELPLVIGDAILIGELLDLKLRVAACDAVPVSFPELLHRYILIDGAVLGRETDHWFVGIDQRLDEPCPGCLNTAAECRCRLPGHSSLSHCWSGCIIR